MKSILLPVEDHDQLATIVGTADRLASRTGATIEAVALKAVSYQVIGADPIVAVSFPPTSVNDDEVLAKAHQALAAVPATEGPAPVRRWRSGPPLDDNGIASLARVYDITVVGRPRSSLSGPRMMSLEAVLFDSGRPILIAPPRSFGVAPLGEAITIAWNCSTETARTVALAMRLLKQAREVSVLTIEGVEVPGPSGEALAECLKLNGIKVTAVTRPQRDRKPGLAMLEEAAALGADLVVKGAYTQSRLRQMIFGGATSQILAHTELPVFMAH